MSRGKTETVQRRPEKGAWRDTGLLHGIAHDREATVSKSELKPKAKEFYTIHQMSLADISRRLNISTRTLQNWKSEEHWDEARAIL